VVTAEEYRLARLTTYWQPFHPDNVYGSGYQLAQALIAFGRGELWGTGLGESVQKLFYLPEAHTDFVFAIWSEETGLVGGLFALGLLVFFLAQCMIIGWQAQKIGNLYGAFICFGIATLFGLQVIINLGVNTGLLPTKGLTLPFFSYGGSSLLICCVMVALVYRVSVEIDSATKNDVVNKTSKNSKKSRKAKNKSAAMANSKGDLNSSNEYVTGFDAYVEELNGGRDDK
jgi:cell division protein FtsW